VSYHDKTILIAHEREFMALYIERMLEETDFEIVANLLRFRDGEDIPAIADPSICIIGSRAPSLSETCAYLRVRFPSSRLVLVYAEEAEKTGGLARTLGMDGCLSLDMSPALFLSGLELIAAGTRCFPQICALENGGPRPLRVTGASADANRAIVLTPRENAVLCLIGEGMANKVIARELAIAESTVKAHLNAVLRKTGTSNRTQAARWAFLNGQMS